MRRRAAADPDSAEGPSSTEVAAEIERYSRERGLHPELVAAFVAGDPDPIAALSGPETDAGYVSPARSDWWETIEGRAARRHLHAWGATLQLRRVSGDPAAVPSPMGATLGGRRGAPCMPDVLTVYAEVDGYVGRQFTRRERELLEWIYVAGLFEEETVTFTFDDGQTVTLSEEEARERPPVRYASVRRDVRRGLRYDLARFPAPEVDALCREWSASRVGFLEQRHRWLAKRLASDLGLGA